jgi:HSP20 family molecular chaperone IbpA
MNTLIANRMMDFFDQEIQPQNELTYTLNLAGTKKKDIKIKHTQNTMYVETPENKYQLRIPANFNIESSKAKYEDGLLVVTVNRKDKLKEVKIS